MPRPYPAAPDRLYTTGDIRIGMLDFFAFQRCGIRGDIADRNSILGKLAEASRRLDYEHRLVLALEACAADLSEAPEAEKDAEFESVVTEALEAVRARLPAIRWNAGFGSDEVAASFRPGAGPLAPGDEAVMAQAGALSTLARAIRVLGTPDGHVDREAIVQAQEILEKARYGARLHRALAAATHYLREAAASLETLSRSGCQEPRLDQVRDAIATTGLVPWLDDLQAQGQIWFRGVEALRAASPAPPPAFRAWDAAEADSFAPRGRWKAFLEARTAFAGALQRCAGVTGTNDRKD